MEQTTFTIENIDIFKKKALCWADSFQVVCALDSNQNTSDKYARYEFLLAVDAIDILNINQDIFGTLHNYRQKNKTWLFGYLSYDIKNEIEHLHSNNLDGLDFPLSYFFEPRYLLSINKNNQLSINRNYPEALALFDLINQQIIPDTIKSDSILLTSRIEKEKYISIIEQIQNHIIEGDVYEMNFCRELFAENIQLNPLAIFMKLNQEAKAPFSAYFKNENQYILCVSPERFLQKKNELLISQPIKGTIKRSTIYEEDELLKSELYHSKKERAENIMIVDLVRNDLTHYAETGSIKVTELFGIHTFNTVHHMISTITAKLKDATNYIWAIKKAFPMGSMTGAPKIKAMELIEKFELTKRGVFSGSIGYFNPENDFDFNVVIRSILYDKKKQYLSVQSGGAITSDSLPEAEWDELKLKSAIIEKIIH